jgi:hydrogenase expression/formation protein HypD
MNKVFEPVDRKWRGIGLIPASGYRIRREFARHDAELAFDVGGVSAEESPECMSALVLQGLKKPVDCSAFGTRCTPALPLGAPMVSNEGACAAYFRYRRHA